MTRFLAFDIEIATEMPEGDVDFGRYRPLGISCAATLASGEAAPRLFHGRAGEGRPAERMTPAEARGLLGELQRAAESGLTLLTWNGLGFDFDVLGEEAGDVGGSARLALDHVDMMFHAFCALGHPIGLDKAARGMGLPGKPPGLTGAMAPRLWKQGSHREVLDYVAADVLATLRVAEAAARERRLRWITQKGTTRSLPLPDGWLTVRSAMALPEPDTSWMTTPLARSRFTSWLAPA